MRQILSNLIRNQSFQDFAAVSRGLYRVCEGVEKPLRIRTQQQMEPVFEQPATDQVQTDPLPPQQNQTQPEFTQNRVPDTSFQRAFQFGIIGVRLASSTVAGVLVGQSWKDSAVSESNAELLAKGLCKMRGAPLKLAQALSIQEDKLIPESIRKAFEKARQTADIMPRKQLEKMMKSQLGADWMSKFEHFEETPFAAASIGQVHRGMVKGVEVAVKVQYPGVRESIDSDMQNLRRLMTYTNIFPKTMFLDRLLEHTRKELFEECDYVIEAQKQERYRNLLTSREYVVPKVFSSLSTERILTAEYQYGVKNMQYLQEDLDYVAANYPQHVRNEVGRRIMELTLRELFQWRFMQSDPNPSNFYYRRSTDQLILLDFGAAHEYSKKFIDLYLEIIHAAAHGNREVCLRKSQDIGFLTGQETLHSILTVGEPFRFDGEFDFGGQTITDKIYELMPVMLKYRLRPPPHEVYSLHRKLSGTN